MERELSSPGKGCWSGWWGCPGCGHFHAGAVGWSGGRSPGVLAQRCCAGKGPGTQWWSWPLPRSPGTNDRVSTVCQRLTRHWELSWSQQQVHGTQHLPWSSGRERTAKPGKAPYALMVPVRCNLNPIKVLVRTRKMGERLWKVFIWLIKE